MIMSPVASRRRRRAAQRSNNQNEMTRSFRRPSETASCGRGVRNSILRVRVARLGLTAFAQYIHRIAGVALIAARMSISFARSSSGEVRHELHDFGEGGTGRWAMPCRIRLKFAYAAPTRKPGMGLTSAGLRVCP